jgi:serine/threonine-protein kinase
MFQFPAHDIFVLERSKSLNAQLVSAERFVSRIQFVIEINPPRARLVDMGNPSGTFVNGKRVAAVELAHLDEIKAGFTQFRVEIPGTGLAGERRAEGSVAKKPQRLTPRIPGFRLDRELGRGPHGVVYEAKREEDGATVAIKTIVPAVEPDSDQVDTILSDVASLWNVKHPHIVSFSEIGEEDGTLWFAMDRIEGTDLGSMIREAGKMEEQMAVRLILQVLAAVEHAHANGLGHGDIKPANVFIEEKLGQKRTVRVADFGVARAYSMLPMSGLSVTDHVNPAMDCLAPEQISDFRSVTAATDQFAAAVLLCRLLTGQSPYNLNPTVHTIGQILDGAIVSLSQRRSDLSRKLVAVIERALALKPAERFPDVGSFADALQRFAN